MDTFHFMLAKSLIENQANDIGRRPRRRWPKAGTSGVAILGILLVIIAITG